MYVEQRQKSRAILRCFRPRKGSSHPEDKTGHGKRKCSLPSGARRIDIKNDIWPQSVPTCCPRVVLHEREHNPNQADDVSFSAVGFQESQRVGAPFAARFVPCLPLGARRGGGTTANDMKRNGTRSSTRREVDFFVDLHRRQQLEKRLMHTSSFQMTRLVHSSAYLQFRYHECKSQVLQTTRLARRDAHRASTAQYTNE